MQTQRDDRQALPGVKLILQQPYRTVSNKEKAENLKQSWNQLLQFTVFFCSQKIALPIEPIGMEGGKCVTTTWLVTAWPDQTMWRARFVPSNNDCSYGGKIQSRPMAMAGAEIILLIICGQSVAWVFHL